MNYDNDLYVKQIIPTIQGEGKNVGKPSLLIRFFGCNMGCPWCDTKESWTMNVGTTIYNNYHKLPPDLDKLMDEYTLTHMMITGGEPTLYVKNPEFRRLLTYSHYKVGEVTKDVETNGFNVPCLLDQTTKDENLRRVFEKKYITFCISPKLFDKNIYGHNNSIYIADLILAIIEIIKKNYNFCLKFVYDNKDRILQFYNSIYYRLNHTEKRILQRNTYVQPLTPDINKYTIKQQKIFMTHFNDECHKTLQFCLEKGFNYSPRLQIYLFKSDKNETINI